MKKSKIIVFIVVMTMLLATLSACSTTKASFKINFEVDGAQYYSVETRGQEAISLPAVPTKEGCIFGGWYFDKDVWEIHFTEDSFLNRKMKRNMTVYARWLTIDECVAFEFTDETQSAYLITGTKTTVPSKCVLPSEYKGKPVVAIGREAFYDCSSLTSVTFEAGSKLTSIGARAFRGCSSLTSVTILASVTSIGDSAFSGCSSLTNIMVESGNANYKSTDGDLYSKDGSILIQYAIGKTATSFTIPAGVTSISDWAFSGCSSLTSITIPAGVTSIGEYAFHGCISLTSVTIPASVTSIGYYAFDDCSSLTSVAIPEGVTSIGERAFRGCSSLTSVTIPASVTSIGGYAFYGCISLTIYAETASWPAGWKSDWDYSNCPVVWDSANNIIASDGNIYAVSEGIRYALKDGNVTVVRQSSAITTANIPEAVTFKNLKYKVTSIGYEAFRYCSSLTSVTIPASVTSIYGYAFSGCSSLTSVTILASVTSIGYEAFSGCSSLTIYAEVASQPAGWNSNWNSSNRPVVWGHNNITANADYDYVIHNNEVYLTKYKGSKLDVAIPEAIDGKTVVSVGSTFSGNKTIKSVQIPASVPSIDGSAFSGCSSLTSITIPVGVTSIGEDAFLSCSSLTIYAEAASKPAGWSGYWNSDGCPVVWGHKN